ncbi:MAG: hypothetical protein ACE5JK_00385 [Candidatus Omnitrophota bacterium]
MGIKDQKKMKFKQRQKRRKKRLKLMRKGMDPDDFYFGRYYVGHKGGNKV